MIDNNTNLEGNKENTELQLPLGELEIDAYQRSLEQQADKLQDAGNRRMQMERQQQEAQQEQIRQEELQQQTSGSIKYEKGYYDGYADALEEIQERLAAEEEDEYDFGRHYSGKADPRKQ